MHIILEIQRSADNGHTFVAKRQVHCRNCGQDCLDIYGQNNASTIFK